MAPHATQVMAATQFTAAEANARRRYALPMAITSRLRARRRFRQALCESPAIPTCSVPIDCTPWVIGGLWPAELSPITAETATLAEYLNADLRRIANLANDELRKLSSAGLTDWARQAAEETVVDEARGRAMRRIESTVRHLRGHLQEIPTAYSGSSFAEVRGRIDPDKTRVMPAITAVHTEAEASLPIQSDSHSSPMVGQGHEPEVSLQDTDPGRGLVDLATEAPADSVRVPETESDDERV